jgi:hypothetical protein
LNDTDNGDNVNYDNDGGGNEVNEKEHVQVVLRDNLSLRGLQASG